MGAAAAEIARLRAASMLESAERKAALAIAREANARSMRAAELEDEVERLRAALREALDGLAGYVEAQYPPHTRHHASERRNYDGEMADIARLRQIAEGG